ncbi:sugar ABC transporter ATP-binding protein [Acuticoccus mangrovi]|uniref:Sugar ABC transporter ATP-binding protein n=1 Tax=Acuticoccus mangrovi TaxID=2796142 RepID=A0A934MFR7_9HYPH|nr:sugar ABC transporter ATP-binding protein [Acuticoccus mangrovi]MBJ3774176.1 sugar ABC transporter ATP-binding protein [Acuticoccus mangrovi]
MSEDASILTVERAEKTFDRTRALDGASFSLREGEIHALLGANGAGKSTLSKVISGHVRLDAGAVTYKGAPLQLRSTREALEAGIAIVMQETSLAPDLSVLENIFLPELGRPGRLSYGSMRRRAGAILADLGREHVLDLSREVARLSAAERQLVEIAKALALDADVIIFDEPTASLSPGEVEMLFDVMARLKASGRSLIFVSHRLEEVFAVTDRVTIMREGRTVAGPIDTTELTQADIIRHMVGREIGAIYATPGLGEAAAGPVVFSVAGLAAPPAVRDVSFAVRKGEILGLGGLVGAGRSESAEAIFGLRPRAAGTLTLNGRPVNYRHPRQWVRAKVGFVPEDRRRQNIVPDLSVKENLLLAHLGDHQGFGRGYARRAARVEELMARLDLPSHRLADASMLNFSGGMQQKIVIARWLLLDPEVLILDEPTKGVDIGTRQAIYAILRQIADEGVAVVVISSDFEELLGVSTRIVVMSDGMTVADLPSAALDEEKLTLLAAPRTSMQKNTELLEDLAARSGGAAFWALIDGDELICLNAVVAGEAASPGFAPGEVRRLEKTRIPNGLAAREASFTADDGGLATLLVPIRNRRNHDLGWVGLTVRGETPPAETITARIEAYHG